jgi:FlaG/FlaF family flagellin (archaellin)
MKRIIEKDSAVSPVVGVMLMLVVTIIIASVISAYVGGLGPNQDQAPQVSVVARVDDTDPSYIYFDHMGGDGFSIEDLTIILDNKTAVLKITTGRIHPDPPNKLENKAGPQYPYIRPGDTIVLKGEDDGGKTTFTLDDSSSISIEHDHEFTWTLLSQRSNAILARGTLAFV